MRLWYIYLSGRNQIYGALVYLSFTTIQVLKHNISAHCGWTAGFAGIIPSFGLESMVLCATPPHHSKTGKCRNRKNSSARKSAVHKVPNLFAKVAAPQQEGRPGALRGRASA